MQSLSPDQIGRWCPIILAFPFLIMTAIGPLRKNLLKLAYEKISTCRA